MSLPAKIFVFLNLILSIAFCVASLSLFAKKVNYVQDAELNIAKRNKQQLDIDAANEKILKLTGDLEKSIAEKDAVIGGLKKNIKSLKQQELNLTAEMVNSQLHTASLTLK